MRDINRIDRILNDIGEIWKRYPDLRLGQLLLNIANSYELYYIEDQQLVDALNIFYGDL